MLGWLVTVAFIAMYLYVVKRERDIRKEQRLKTERADEKRAKEILSKSLSRTPERVRKLDDAGYRD